MSSPTRNETPSTSRKRLTPPTETPGPENRRKTSHVSRACDVCRRAKSKCSGTVPCDNCTKKGIECLYNGRYSRGKARTPPPATEQTVIAEARTGRVDNSRSRVSFRLENGDADTMADDVEETQHSRGSPDLEVTEIEGQLLDPSSALTFLHRAWKRLASQKSVVTNDASEKRQMWMAAGDEPFDRTNHQPLILPDKDTCSSLILFYFDTCVVTYRFLHRVSVMAWLDVILNNVRNNMRLSHGIGNARTAIILTLMAISTVRQEKIQGRDVPESERLSKSDWYFCAGRDILSADDFELGLPRLEAAQARLIQVLYLLQTSRMNQGWYLFGSCLQVISALGLHRKSGRKSAYTPRGSSNTNLDYITIQYRKRTFWVAYTIDAYLAVVFGRPRHYHDDDIDQDFPESVNDEDMTAHGPDRAEPGQDCHVDSLIAHAKLAKIIGEISRQVYTTRNIPRNERLESSRRLGRDLLQWRSDLPLHLAVRPSSLVPGFRRQAVAMSLAHSHAVMHANRPFLMKNTSSAAAKDCISAARKALQTVDSIATDGSLFHALWWTHYVTFCALAIVYVLEIQQAEDDSLQPLFELAERCHGYLIKKAAANSPSQRYGVILEELRMEAKRQTSSAAVVEQAPQQPYDDVDAPFDPSFFGVQPSLWSEWQTANWLDLDSSAFGPLSDPGDSPLLWTTDLAEGVTMGH